MIRIAMSASVVMIIISLAGCREGGQLPPVFGAVFGLSGAASTPFDVGKIPEKPVDSGDRLVGAAANNPGLCIWRDPGGRRFRAVCPEGYAP